MIGQLYNSKVNSIIFILVLFLNHWIWLIFKKDFPLFLLTLLFTTSLYFYYYSKKSPLTLLLFSCFLFFCLNTSYVLTTEKTSLIQLSSLSKDLQQKRLNSYPSPPIPLLPGIIAYKIPHLLEQKEITISIYRLQDNLTNYFDPNYYFFGSYPKEMQIPGEFSKFSFFSLLFLLLGVFEFKKTKKLLILLYFLLSVLLVALVGDRNHLGVFVSFPFLVLLITLGIQKFVKSFKINYENTFIK